MSGALVILSGGQDSTTCLYWARARHSQVVALTFDYRQRHRRELDCAREVARLAGVEHEVIDIGPIFSGLSPLTDSARPVQQYPSAEALPGGVEDTFVPGRNILFLSIAANRAYVRNCDLLVIGVGQEDYGGYPDCRADFVDKMAAAIGAGLDRTIAIEAPLMYLDKKGVVELAASIPGCLEALGYSHTCYRGDFPPCGTCHACLLRARGFADAGIEDPLLKRARGAP